MVSKSTIKHKTGRAIGWTLACALWGLEGLFNLLAGKNYRLYEEYMSRLDVSGYIVPDDYSFHSEEIDISKMTEKEKKYFIESARYDIKYIDELSDGRIDFYVDLGYDMEDYKFISEVCEKAIQQYPNYRLLQDIRAAAEFEIPKSELNEFLMARSKVNVLS